MSFGFSIGDFLAVIERANKLRKVFVAAPAQFNAISDEVRSLSIVVRDVEVNISDDLSSQQESELSKIAESCRNVLIDIENVVNQYCEINTRGTKRIWKRLTWVPDDIRELQSRVASNISILNAFNGIITRDNTMSLLKHANDAQHLALLDWLSSTGYATQQTAYIGRRQPGTGEWLLKSSKFQTWIEGTNETLFCPGMPGAGKTILASVVIDELISRHGNNSEIGIAYLYCNFQRHEDQCLTADGMLASILRQLAQSLSPMPDVLVSLYEKHRTRGTRPTADELSRALGSVHGHFSRVFVVLDALDECRYHVISQILDRLFGLQMTSNLNLLATSRHIPEIVARFQNNPVQEISASRPDIMRYLSGNLCKLPLFVSRNPQLQQEITTGIADAVNGMFLLAKLYLDSLEGKKSPRALRFELEKMRIGPKASGSAYDSAYDEAMQRIMGQGSDRRSLAWGVLSWTTCAKRPLTATELLNALAVELDEPKFYEDNLPDLEDIISVCSGLITVSSDASGDIVQLVHYTTQEYFERTWERWFPDAHCNIATICVTYLSFDVFQTGYCLTDADLESRLEEYPFYSYAAKSWGDHARVQPISQDLMTAFLQDPDKVNASVQAIFARKGFSSIGEYSQQIPFTFTSFHLAAYFGLVDTMQSMIQSGYPYMVQCSMERTSLAWATYAGHIEPVKLLLGLGMSPIDYDYDGQSPITLAASMGCADIVSLLLEHGAHADSKDITGQTCLSLAAYRGHERVVELLLNNGANPEYKDETGQSPLSWAASNGWVGVALLLLERSVDLESKDMFGRTPLSWAAENGHINMLTLLIQRGADPDSKDADGHTPLFWASHYGHETVVQLLQQQPTITQAPILNNIDSMIQENAEQSTHQNPFDNWSRMRSRSRRTTLRKNPTGQTRFHCPLCLDKVDRTIYSSAGTFKRHVYNRHYARFEYQCPAAECFDTVSGKSRVFARVDNLRAHALRMHKLDLTLADRDKWQPQNPCPEACPVCHAPIASWEAFHSCILSHSYL